MLLSRFWYVLLSLLLAAVVFTLYLAQSMYNRTNARSIAEGLSSDSQVVSWYLRSLSRERSGQLIQFALDPTVSQSLATASARSSVPKALRGKTREALTRVLSKVPSEFGFDAVFAVDQHGRVIGQVGFEAAEAHPDFELGGYPIVADALHGYIRDDTFVWDRLYTAVARPVEHTAGELPVGAILGLRLIDDRFAKDITARTGAAVAFYVGGERVASGAPDDFDRAELDGIINDLSQVDSDEDYAQRGRSGVRYLSQNVGVIYSKLPGETWARGAGYVVGRSAQQVESPFAFFGAADDKDKSSASLVVVILVALVGLGVGIGLTFIEHTRPLTQFRNSLAEVAEGKSDQLQASKVTGVYRKLVSLINDAIERAAAKGGNRRVADFNQVLGDVPEQPAMSAFSFPDSSASVEQPASISQPRPAAVPVASAIGAAAPQGVAAGGPPAGPPRSLPKPPLRAAGPRHGGESESNEEVEWRMVYEEFVATKRNCGEPTDSLSYEKFEGTLRKNKTAIVQQHGVQRVKFTVYVKQGRAALKASPIRDEIA